MCCLDMSGPRLTQPCGLVNPTWPPWTGLGARHRAVARADSRHGCSGHVPEPGSGRSARGLAQNLHDRVETAVEHVLLDHERRRENQDAATTAAAAYENASVAQYPLGRSGQLRLGQLDSEKEAAPADIADLSQLVP